MSVEECRDSAPLHLHWQWDSVICFNSWKACEETGQDQAWFVPSCGGRFCSRVCWRAWRAKVPHWSEGALKKLAVCWGFKALSSLYCHILNEGVALGFSFDPLQFSVGEVPWKNNQPVFQFVPVNSIMRLLRNSWIKYFESSYIWHWKLDKES